MLLLLQDMQSGGMLWTGETWICLGFFPAGCIHVNKNVKSWTMHPSAGAFWDIQQFINVISDDKISKTYGSRKCLTNNFI